MDTHSNVMKKTSDIAENNTDNSTQLTDNQINEMENDTLWDFLDQAKATVEASPVFSRNVMHEVRSLRESDETETSSPSFWNRITSPNFAKIGLGVAAAAACALIVTKTLSDPNTGSDAGPLTDASDKIDIDFIDDIPLQELSAFSNDSETSFLEDTFTAEFLDLADQDPLFLSEEELDVAMNF